MGWGLHMVDWLGLFLLIAGVLLVFLLMNEVNEQQKRKSKRPRPRPKQVGAETAIAKVQAYTHNRETAIRLIHQCCGNNPGRSLSWVVDKVVYDLERDRR